MKRRTIKSQLVMISMSLLLIPLGIIGFLSYTKSKANFDDLGKANLKNSVESALQMIALLDEEVQQGHMLQEEAEEKAKIAFLGERSEDGTRSVNQSIDLGKHGYVYVLDEKGTAVAHPLREGEDMWASTDPNGVLSSQKQIEVANNGGGYTYFSWPMPNDEKRIEPKVVYSKKDPHWGWVVNAGTYMLDFNEPANEILRTLMVLSVVTVLVGGTAVWLFAASIASPLSQTAERMDGLAEGNLTGEHVTSKRLDEVGKLATSMNFMQEQLRHLIENVSSASRLVQDRSEELLHSSQGSVAKF